MLDFTAKVIVTTNGGETVTSVSHDLPPAPVGVGQATVILSFPPRHYVWRADFGVEGMKYLYEQWCRDVCHKELERDED